MDKLVAIRQFAKELSVTPKIAFRLCQLADIAATAQEEYHNNIGLEKTATAACDEFTKYANVKGFSVNWDQGIYPILTKNNTNYCIPSYDERDNDVQIHSTSKCFTVPIYPYEEYYYVGDLTWCHEIMFKRHTLLREFAISVSDIIDNICRDIPGITQTDSYDSYNITINMDVANEGGYSEEDIMSVLSRITSCMNGCQPIYSDDEPRYATKTNGYNTATYIKYPNFTVECD